MNNNDHSDNKEDKNFGKSDSFEHMIAMQEQIFNPPVEEVEGDKPVTDFSSFGGDKVTNVNDLAAKSGIKANSNEGEKEEEKEEEFVDSRSEAEMHSLFSDPSAGTTQDVDPEEKRILDEERRAEEMARKDEELSVVIPPREEKKEPESLIPTPAPAEEKHEDKPAEEEHHDEPKEEEHHDEEHHDEPEEEHPAEEHHDEEHHDEPKEEEHHDEEHHDEEHHDEPKEEEHHDEPKEEEHHDEEHHDDVPTEEEHHDEGHHDEPEEEHPAEEHHDEQPAVVADVEETEPKGDDMRDVIRKRLEHLRVERNILIVDMDKLEDALFDENDPNFATAKEQLKEKRHELRHKTEVIAGLIDLLHTL